MWLLLSKLAVGLSILAMAGHTSAQTFEIIETDSREAAGVAEQYSPWVHVQPLNGPPINLKGTAAFPFTFSRQIKLGASYFVDYPTAKAAQVFYLWELPKEVETKTLKKLIMNGGLLSLKPIGSERYLIAKKSDTWLKLASSEPFLINLKNTISEKEHYLFALALTAKQYEEKSPNSDSKMVFSKLGKPQKVVSWGDTLPLPFAINIINPAPHKPTN